MKHLFLLFALLMVVVSCRTTRSIERESHTESTSVVHDTVYSTSYRDRVVTDTLRDSVYIREVVTTEGKTVYVEKNTSRDHKAQTIVKHDTVFIRVNETAKSDIAQTEVVETKTTSRHFAPYIIILAAGLLIGISIELYKYLKQR